MTERVLRPLASPLWLGDPVKAKFDVFEVENSTAFVSFPEHTNRVPKHILVRPNERITWRDLEVRGVSGAAIGFVMQYMSLLYQLAFRASLPRQDIGYRIIFDSQAQDERAEINVWLGHKSCFGPNGLVRGVTESALRRDLEIVEAVQKTLAASLEVKNQLRPHEGD